MMRGIVWLFTAAAVTAASFLLYGAGKAWFDPHPNLQWLNIYGDYMDNYDMDYMNPDALDWPVGIIWRDDASLDDVRSYLSPKGYGPVSGASKFVRVWEDSQGGDVEWSDSMGNQTGCFDGPDPEATSDGCKSGDRCMRHTRTYADNQYFSNGQWGHYILATAHYDTNHAGCVGSGNERFGWSETVEQIIVNQADADGFDVKRGSYGMFMGNAGYGDIDAKHYHESDGYASFIDFYVVPNPPSWVKSDFTSTSTDKISWESVDHADYYYLCTDFSPTGGFSNCAYRTSTYFNAGVTTGASNDGVRWYNKVKACNSSDICSALSADYTLTEAAWFSGWQYVFTSWRNGSDIDTRSINFSWIDMKWYIKNGSSTSSPNVDSTSYFEPGEISSWEHTPRTEFTHGSSGRRIEGTRGRTANGYAPSTRWGYVNAP